MPKKLSGNHDVALFESYTKIDNNVIVASLNSESACKLINRIPGLRLLISSLAMSISVLKALPGKLDIKRHSPSILYISNALAYVT